MTTTAGYFEGSGSAVCPSNATNNQAAHLELACEVQVTRVGSSCGSDTEGCKNANSGEPGEPSIYTSTGGMRPATEGGDNVYFEMFVQRVSGAQYVIALDNMGSDTQSALLRAEAFCAADKDDNTTLICPLPPGTGQRRSARLMQIVTTGGRASITDTGILTSFLFDYAEPVVTAVIGCSASGCNRSGGDLIEVQGANFGQTGSLVFINGLECVGVAHGAAGGCLNGTAADLSNCHRKLACQVPPLRDSQSVVNALTIIQNSKWGTTHNFSYEKCARGQHQVRGSGECEFCQAGDFAALEDQFECDHCTLGKISTRDGAHECQDCGENTYAGDVGVSECRACETGYFASAGSSLCSQCTMWYLGSPGHCDIPVLGYLLAFVGAVLLLLAVLWMCKRQKRHTIQKRKLKHDLLKQTEQVQSHAHDINLLQKAWQISWDQLEVQDKIAKGGGGVVYRARLQGTDIAVKEIFGTKDEDVCAQAEVKWMQR